MYSKSLYLRTRGLPQPLDAETDWVNCPKNPRLRRCSLLFEIVSGICGDTFSKGADAERSAQLVEGCAGSKRNLPCPCVLLSVASLNSQCPPEPVRQSHPGVRTFGDFCVFLKVHYSPHANPIALWTTKEQPTWLLETNGEI